MHRISNSPALGRTNDPWKGLEWHVTLKVNSRQLVTRIQVEAIRRNEEGSFFEGFSEVDVAPFDDLKKILRTCLEEAALASHDHQGMNVSLFELDDPFPA